MPVTLPLSSASAESAAVYENNALNVKIASYDIDQRIKQLGGGPFCINPKTDQWVVGNPRQRKIHNAHTCNEWRAGHMASDRRIKDWVDSCTCIN